MALKSVVVIVLVVAAIAAVPMAEAQLGGIIGNLFGLIRVQGTVFCTANGNIGVNGSATPVFPNAQVQLQCGSKVVSSATTNNNGIFSILLDPLEFLLSTVLSNCNLAVTTPLSRCNTGLPSVGSLVSTLQLIGNTLQGLLNIFNLIPTGFQFQAA